MAIPPATDAVTLAGQITEATTKLHDPCTAIQVREAANEFLMKVSEHPAFVPAATQLAGPSSPPNARFFAFQLLHGAAVKGRLQAQDPQARAHVCESLVNMLRQSTLDLDRELLSVPYVREKFAQALAAVVVYASGWPAAWPQLQTLIFEAGQRSPLHAALALAFFRDVCEVLQSDAIARLGPQRRKVLQGHLTETCVEIFAAVLHFTGTLFPDCPELDRAAVLLAQEMAVLVPVAKFLSTDTDRFLHRKLGDRALSGEVLQVFSALLDKDIAQDLREPSERMKQASNPGRMKQFLFGIFELANFCSIESWKPEDYDAHKKVATVLRDFVESNKPSLERHPDLQAGVYGAAVKLMRYPSVFIQTEAASIVPHVIRASLPDARKGGAAPEPAAPPAWLRPKGELLPLVFLSVHKEISPSFDLFPLPPTYRQIMELTSELDMEEDMDGLRTHLKGRAVEIMMAMTPSPPAILESLEFIHELLPRVLQAGNHFASFEAALTLVERVMPHVKPSAGVPAVEACRVLLVMLLQSQLPGPEHEFRRLEFLSRVGAVFDLIAEVSPGQGSPPLIVQVFMHLFKVIEAGSVELRTRALYSFIGVSKTAPKSIRPVLADIVNKAEQLLQSIPHGQHVLCESLVSASTAARNFDQQACLLRNLLSRIIAGWNSVADVLMVPQNLLDTLLNDRSPMDNCRQFVLCFEGCFRASTVPADPAVAAAGGFVRASTGTPAEISIRNPAAEIVTGVFPKLIGLIRTFHSTFPSDVTRPMTGLAGDTAESLRPYLLALDREELKALTSSFDTKNKDQDFWEKAFPPPPNLDVQKVYKGRHLLYLLRCHLYKCVGAALGTQDGTLTNPELPALLSSALIESMEFAHPLHLELQLRHIWLTLFGPTGMSAASEPLRRSLASALLPSLLSTTARTLDRYWQWLQLPEGHPAAVDGNNALLWAMCSGTVMASRTFVELLTSLLIHGGPAKDGEFGNDSGAIQAGVDGMGGKKNRKAKNRQGKAATDENGMTDRGNATNDGSGKQDMGFAKIVLTTPELLEAVQGALCSAVRWKDAKTIGHALVGMHAIAVRLMSGGESYQHMRDIHAVAVEAPQRCAVVLRVVLQPLVNLCISPPAPPPGDGALHTIIGKPFHDFFCPEVQQGRLEPSGFAGGITNACWPIVWGMCQVFVQVCKRNQAKAEIQHVAQFHALAEACQLLTTLKCVSEQDVQNLLSTFLEPSADAKAKKVALRSLIRSAVDPEQAAAVS